MVLAVSESSPRPVVGVDLGGTTTKAALVSPDLELLAHEAVPTDTSDQKRLLDSLEALVAKVRDGTEMRAYVADYFTARNEDGSPSSATGAT